MCSQSGQHNMNLRDTHDSGVEEWFCPVCGRVMIIQRVPSFRWMILEAGDEDAVHSGSRGGISIQSVTITDQDNAGNSEADLSEEEEAKLIPWKEWIEKNNFDHLWNDENK